ncbi:Protein of unknown function [Butyrivibrio fibrisolvens]|uniref:CBM2 domain-containing protein n=1 Tax=Butyrivibrio fibrisolvens TaxID=831 RepID=A0A1H9S662_BUTFI|nr:cellulose binding domain-containing protein [Butyrivibrio fibrisolvens]SER79833.1 Protein of unknown function [Butyrivibrio fibrisolvens]
MFKKKSVLVSSLLVVAMSFNMISFNSFAEELPDEEIVTIDPDGESATIASDEENATIAPDEENATIDSDEEDAAITSDEEDTTIVPAQESEVTYVLPEAPEEETEVFPEEPVVAEEPVAAEESADPGYKVTFALLEDWGDGYNAGVTIENTSDRVIEDWKLSMAYDAPDFTTIWNGVVESHENGVFVINNCGWNQDIPVGGSVFFGFSVGAAFNGEPTDFKNLNAKTDTQEEDYTVTYEVIADWGTGFTGQVTITNNTDKTIEDWGLEFDFANEITQIWNGIIEQHENGRYVIKNAVYNQNIPAGESVSFGFNVVAPWDNPDVTVDSSAQINDYVLTKYSEEAETLILAIYGRVINAVNGSSIEGAVVRLREGKDNQEGDFIAEAVSTENGDVQFAVKEGDYTAEVSIDGFITGYFNVTAVEQETVEPVVMAISPVLPEGQYRIVLTWNPTPRDLDSHLDIYGEDGGKVASVSYRKTELSSNGEVVATLDVDNTGGLGPETITIDIDNEYFNGKTLKYVAYNYSGNPVIAESGATVNVYKGSVLVDTFEVPASGSGNAWYVFDIDADGVHEVNELIQYSYR